MNSIEEEQLKVEIQHIFDSGANETRILEMVKSFINSRKVTNDLSKHIVRERELRKCDLVWYENLIYEIDYISGDIADITSLKCRTYDRVKIEVLTLVR